MSFLRKNFSKGYLASTISDAALQMTLSVGHTLPTDAGNFRLIIWDNVTYPDPAEDPNIEIITASYSGTPNIYDIVRAQEGTLAVSHSVGDKVALTYTAGVSIDDLIEVDPLFIASPASGILAGDITNWDTAYLLSHSSASVGGAPLSIIGQQIYFDYNSTNLKLTASQLDTIQSIALSSSPTFTKLTLSQATGIAPLIISSTTVVTNLNADLWDGNQFSDYLNQAVKTTSEVSHKKLTLTQTSDAVIEKSVRGSDSSPVANLKEIYKNNGTDLLFAIERDGRIRTGVNTAAPSVAAGSGAGGSPTVSISGSDSGGEITLNTGTSPQATDDLFTVTFSRQFTNATSVALTPSNAAAAALYGATSVNVTSTASSFTVNSGSAALAASTEYKWFYHVLGR